LALDGLHLMGGHNNQPKVVVVNGEGVLERRRRRAERVGGVVPLLGASN
jgi:hypothetical protein